LETEFDNHHLRRWFFLSRRHLPWRENSSPYAVWVSEIMLQQTQVAVVIPYFERWMTLFPTVKALAEAPLDQVIKTWEGLGYYSRARNLHAGARMLLENHGGELPEDPIALQKIKGIGPYTVGAIRSFAFKQKAAAVDGNVLRVLARYYAIEEAIDKSATRLQIEKLTQSILPEKEPWIVMEALIELGALVCQKKPLCKSCPLNGSCLAYKEERTGELPVKGKKIPTTLLHRLVNIIESEGMVLLRKGEKEKVMADLFEFPYIEALDPIIEGTSFQGQIEKEMGLSLSYQTRMPQVSHSFTRYKALLYPQLWRAKQALPVQGFEWVSVKELSSKPFSSGHRRILKGTMHQLNSLIYT